MHQHTCIHYSVFLNLRNVPSNEWTESKKYLKFLATVEQWKLTVDKIVMDHIPVFMIVYVVARSNRCKPDVGILDRRATV